MTSHSGLQTIAIHILPTISERTGCHEPTNTEFCSDAATDRAIRPLISTRSQSQLCRDTTV